MSKLLRLSILSATSAVLCLAAPLGDGVAVARIGGLAASSEAASPTATEPGGQTRMHRGRTMYQGRTAYEERRRGFQRHGMYGGRSAYYRGRSAAFYRERPGFHGRSAYYRERPIFYGRSAYYRDRPIFYGRSAYYGGRRAYYGRSAFYEGRTGYCPPVRRVCVDPCEGRSAYVAPSRVIVERRTAYVAAPVTTAPLVGGAAYAGYPYGYGYGGPGLFGGLLGGVGYGGWGGWGSGWGGWGGGWGGRMWP